MWHICDVEAVWVRAFAAALAKQVPALGWLPRPSLWGWLKSSEVAEQGEDGLRTWRFPLQLGFRRFPLSLLVDERRRVIRRVAKVDSDLSRSTLLISLPLYQWLPREWPGYSIYYATDSFRFWGSWRERIERAEQAMCGEVDLVCVNSARIADYMITELGVRGEKIALIPNATPSDDILPACPDGPMALPPDAADLPRPIAGVIGNLAGNLDWPLIEEAVRGTPWLSWLFVGPTEMTISSQRESEARSRLINGANRRLRFVGSQPYRKLRDYARSFDVAILPYKKIEPTYSGSSTRFYGHLAACRPMLATRGFEELLHKEPLLKLVDTAAQMVSELERLRSNGFRDGYERLRWERSLDETFDARAASMRRALAERVGSLAA